MVRGASPSRQAASPSVGGELAEQALGGLAQEPLAAAVDQPEPPLAIEGEDGHVDLLHHPPQQRRRLERAEPLRAQRVASAFTSSNASPSASSGLAPRRADGVVALAQRGQQVGERLQRAEHALAPGQRGPDEPRARRRSARRSTPDAERMIAGPQQASSATSTAGRPARSASAEHPRLVTGGAGRAAGSEPMVLEPAIERAPAQAQRLGGLAHVAAVARRAPSRMSTRSTSSSGRSSSARRRRRPRRGARGPPP